MIAYINLIIYFFLVLIFAVLTLFVARLVRFRDPRYDAVKLQPYECGEDPIGDAWVRFPVSFYLIALVFVLFDVEAAFIFPWVLALPKLGVIAFIEMLVFLVILFLGWIYAFKKGALRWERNQ